MYNVTLKVEEDRFFLPLQTERDEYQRLLCDLSTLKQQIKGRIEKRNH
ncbi:hypothetical protein [Scytonema sp. NUACC26]